jgi:hypothetical protein
MTPTVWDKEQFRLQIDGYKRIDLASAELKILNDYRAKTSDARPWISFMLDSENQGALLIDLDSGSIAAISTNSHEKTVTETALSTKCKSR